MSNSDDQFDGGVIPHWAHQLGLVASALFGRRDSAPMGAAHFALLDGRRASFACSVVDDRALSPSESQNWQWSADLRHHVMIKTNEVIVRSGTTTTKRFLRSSVEQQLEDFYLFLENSRRAALPDVVPFLVNEFLQLWSIMPRNSPQGVAALAVFLLSLHATGEFDPSVMEDQNWRQQNGTLLGLEGPALDVLNTLNPEIIQRAIGLQSRSPEGLRIVPELVLRHASGRLFQEAHAYLESAQLGLWGEGAVVTVPTFSPTGAYFTPVPIARLLAETALQSLGDLPDSITVADFACGSAVFLCEFMRELERRKYRGEVRLIGRDRSPEAVTMAKVAIATTVRDLVQVSTKIDLKQVNMLDEADWPIADIALMNPPFRSWENMSNEERHWVRGAMETPRGRPDLTVGFVEYALRSLRPGGVLATLVPAGLLASEGLSSWRNSLAERSTPKLIAILGEHSLFRHAFVNVGILVLKKDSPDAADEIDKRVSVAWASPDTGAASDVIRALRRRAYFPAYPLPRASSQPSWTVTQTSLRVWKERASWLPGPGVLGPLLESLQSTISTRVEDLFTVRQGIRTGANEVFVISADALRALPEAERSFFRPAVDAASFVEGEIRPRAYLFVPPPAWDTEVEVNNAVPEYFKSYLKPAKDKLKGRKKIDPLRWWRLTWPRGWAFDGVPRLVSKRFGLYPAFARDLEGNLAIVQANAWIPTKPVSGSRVPNWSEILTEYWWLLNSRVMVALLREYCPNVAGGQFDLERKYVRHIPLPNLADRLQVDPGLQNHAIQLRTSFPSELPPLLERDKFAAAAYGTSLDDWTIAAQI